MKQDDLIALFIFVLFVVVGTPIVGLINSLMLFVLFIDLVLMHSIGKSILIKRKKAHLAWVISRVRGYDL